MRQSSAAMQAEIETLRRELEEARSRQAATAAVLNIISRFAFDLQSVLDALVLVVEDARGSE